MSELAEQKAALRRDLRTRMRAVPEAERAAAAARARDLLASRPEWREAEVVMLFAPMPEELDIWPLATAALAEGRRVVLPRFDPAAREYHAAEVKDLARDVIGGSFGLREPGPGCPRHPLNQLDLILVPGLGFDRDGHRLGRGKGYYDRLLAARSGTACGLAMDWQVLPAIPVEPHDQYVDCILTPSRWLAVARRPFD